MFATCVDPGKTRQMHGLIIWSYPDCYKVILYLEAPHMGSAMGKRVFRHADSIGPDQPVHLGNLIRVFTVL